MAEHVVICSECEAENKDWIDQDGTNWFTCVKCGTDNEQVYAVHK